MAEKSNFSEIPEKMIPLHDPASGLRGAIAIHSTYLGPAAGGCRIWSYGTDHEVSADAMRLARGMTLKNALAGLPFGGGKAVLHRPKGEFDRQVLFAAFGRAVAALDGQYVTAEDVGTNISDMETVSTETRHVAGLGKNIGKPGGDPSPWTALGVFESMKVAVQTALHTDLSQVTVAVQGLGHVGFALCELLYQAGAKLVVAEPKSALAAQAAVMFDAAVAGGRIESGTSSIGLTHADIFAPCALGGSVTRQLASQMKAKIICGAANNQLADRGVAEILADRDILYAPDYLVNAGGIINVAAEYSKWSESEVEKRVSEIAPRLQQILALARKHGTTTELAAERFASEILNSKSPKRARAA